MSERSDWPIVVGGCHRSGTSLVRRILDSHPRIHCGPELTFFRDFYGEYREDPYARLRFARTVRDLVPEDEALDILGRAFVRLHERAAQRAGKSRWADKAPENVLYLEQWERLLEGRFLLVHVVRNPLDTIASMQGRFPLTLPEGLDARVDLFRAFTEAGLAFDTAHPDRCRRLVYEDLCSMPVRVVDDLMTWLGEDSHQAQLAFNEQAHQEGLEDPEIAGTGGIHRTSVNRWESVLGADEAENVWDRTSDLWERLDPAGRHRPALVRGSP